MTAKEDFIKNLATRLQAESARVGQALDSTIEELLPQVLQQLMAADNNCVNNCPGGGGAPGSGC